MDTSSTVHTIEHKHFKVKANLSYAPEITMIYINVVHRKKQDLFDNIPVYG